MLRHTFGDATPAVNIYVLLAAESRNIFQLTHYLRRSFRNEGPEYGTPNSRILCFRTPRQFRQPYCPERWGTQPSSHLLEKIPQQPAGPSLWSGGGIGLGLGFSRPGAVEVGLGSWTSRLLQYNYLSTFCCKLDMPCKSPFELPLGSQFVHSAGPLVGLWTATFLEGIPAGRNSQMQRAQECVMWEL